MQRPRREAASRGGGEQVGHGSRRFPVAAFAERGNTCLIDFLCTHTGAACSEDSEILLIVFCTQRLEL